MLLKDLTAREAARQTNIRAHYCEVILAAAKRHAPAVAVVEFSPGVAMNIAFDPAMLDEPLPLCTIEVTNGPPFILLSVNWKVLIIRESVVKKTDLAKKGRLPKHARVVALAQLGAAIDEILQPQPKPRRGLFGLRRR